MPPLLTGGACTAEFDHEASQVAANQKSLATPTLAQAYWSSRQVPISVVSAEQCRRAKPRFVAACGSGVLVHAVVPVQNRICRFYRDDEIRDRKSTRLNSSHTVISYAVFCLKKKTTEEHQLSKTLILCTCVRKMDRVRKTYLT